MSDDEPNVDPSDLPDEGGVQVEAETESTGGGTTETDYRWRWLSTLWAIGYGFGFPLWVASPSGLDVPGPVLATLLLAWGGTVVYVIGPENVEAWQSLRGGAGG